jgi:hypothetical protein
MTQRFFRSSPETYEAARQAFDAAFGFPDAHTVTCIEPAATGVIDADGLVYAAIDAGWCDLDEVAAVLPGLLADGAVEEIDWATYQSVFPSLP